MSGRVGLLARVPLAGIVALGPGSTARATQSIEVGAISSRPDVVSGGDVLVELVVPGGTRWTADLGGRDVTRSFRPGPRSGALIALLSGLPLGPSALTIRADGRTAATLELRNHSRAGPVFSGPHQKPFICQTEANGLGPALNSDCHAKTVVRYYYKSSDAPGPASTAAPAPGTLTPGFKPYDREGPRPRDLARTVTSGGRAVDYIVRREVGVINRAVYEIQFLHRPGEPLPTPWSGPTGGWNGRLAYEFKVGCGPGYRQGTLADPFGSVQEPLVGQGYAIATSTLNSFMNDCNDRISAETLSMVKEHFIEQYGSPVHTIGWGGSGGAMQVHLIAQNYPGLLDGIIPMASFPDVASWLLTVTDCSLLYRAFKASKQSWAEEEKAAVYGHASWTLCDVIANVGPLQLADPRICDPVVPKELVYDPVANPKGARCDIYDNEINVFGRDPRTGFARRPLDNVGVQYGLVAFNRGRISAEQFVELNELVGGFDGDGNIIPPRTEADSESVRLAYQRGLVLTGGGGLSEVPILDWRPYSDHFGGNDGHVKYLSFSTRARLIAAAGNADNQVIVVDRPEAWFDWKSHFWAPIGTLVRQVDRWLDAIAADRGEGTRAAKVARNKPNDLADGCIAPDGERIVEPATYQGSGRCDRLYPSYGKPRIAAGGPVADDVLKCALKPIRGSDYARPLTEAQLDRLRAVFPTGVCDYSRAGAGQQVTALTWQKF